MSRVHQATGPFYILAADCSFDGPYLFLRKGPPLYEIFEIGDDGGLVTVWPDGKDDDLNFENGHEAQYHAHLLFGEHLEKLKHGWDYELADEELGETELDEAKTTTPMIYCELEGVAVRYNMETNAWESDETPLVVEYLTTLESEGEWEDSGADPQPPVDRIRRMMNDLDGKLLAVLNYPERKDGPNVIY